MFPQKRVGPQRTWSSKSFLADAYFVTAMIIMCGIILNLKAFSVLLDFEKKSLLEVGKGSTSVSDVRNAAIFFLDLVQ